MFNFKIHSSFLNVLYDTFISFYRNPIIFQVATLLGVAVFMIVSSVFKIPVSATHAIVGATLAASLYLRGNTGIKWAEIIGIGTTSRNDGNIDLMKLIVRSYCLDSVINSKQKAQRC